MPSNNQYRRGSLKLQAEQAELRTRLLRTALLLMFVLAMGTTGYWWIGDGDWTPIDCLYMTIITLTTVGFGEVIPLETHSGARTFTIFIIFAGMGTMLYFASTLTAFFVEGSVRSLFGHRKMLKEIKSMHDHVIVCGLGKTGSHVVEELVKSGHQCIALELDLECIESVQERIGQMIPAVVGNATRDEDLVKAGVKNAKILVVSLGGEVENLYCTLSARQLNPNIRIIVASDDIKQEHKFEHAGADSVVYTAVIGGRRVASEIIRPDVVTFLDMMLRDPKSTLRFEQIEVPKKSVVCGKTLAMSGIRKAGHVLVVATREPETGNYRYNPKPTCKLDAGDVLIVLGDQEQIGKVRAYVSEH